MADGKPPRAREAGHAAGRDPAPGLHVHDAHRQARVDRALAAHAVRLVHRRRRRLPADDGAARRDRRTSSSRASASGASTAGGLGLRHPQLRLVDRHRPRRHADLGDPAAAAPAVAQLDQPLRRGDDDLRRRVRRPLPAAPHGPAVARLLAAPLPEHDGHVAELPQPADLGRLRRLDVRDGLAALLVRRHDPGPRDAARPREEAAGRRSSTARSRWAGAARRGTGSATRRRRCCSPASRRRSSSRSTRSCRFDFAAGIVPGWHATIFPPYFVAGAIYAGFAMVLTLAIPLRKIYGLEDFITMKHLDNMAKIMLATGLIVGYGYVRRGVHGVLQRQHLRALHDLEPDARARTSTCTGRCIFCNIIAPQMLWFRKVRRNVPALFCMAMIVNVGMWLERYVIVVVSLSPRLPAVVVGHVPRRRSSTGRRSSARSASSSRCCSSSSASCR